MDEMPWEIDDNDTPNMEVPDLHEYEDEVTTNRTTTSTPKPAEVERKTRKTRSNLSPKQVREIASRTIRFAQADEANRSLFAQIYGCSEDPVEMTVASFGDEPAGLAALESVVELDSFAATATVAGMSKPNQKALWQILSILGAELPTKMPGGMAGTVTLARAVSGTDLSGVESVRGLAS